MPRYFFHISHTDRRVEDLEGADFDTVENAREEAAASLRELIAVALMTGRPCTLAGIDIADDEGLVVATVDLVDATKPVLTIAKPVIR